MKTSLRYGTQLSFIVVGTCPHYNAPRYNVDSVIVRPIIGPEILPAGGRIVATFMNTSRGTRWGKIISVSDLELYEI